MMAFAKCLQVVQIRPVGNVVEADVQSAYAEFGFENARPFPQQFHQRQRILASRQPDQYMVAVLHQAIVLHGFPEAGAQAQQQLFVRMVYGHF